MNERFHPDPGSLSGRMAQAVGCGSWWCQRDTQEGRQNERGWQEEPLGAYAGHTRWKRDKQVENSNFYLNKKTPKGRKEKPGAALWDGKGEWLPFAGCHGPAQLLPHILQSSQGWQASRLATRRGTKHSPVTPSWEEATQAPARSFFHGLSGGAASSATQGQPLSARMKLMNT